MQTAYTEAPSALYAGMPADLGPKDVISRVVCSRKVCTVVATTADNSQAFTITINGTAHTYTSDGSGTTTEIATGLQALLDASEEPITSTRSGTTLTIVSDLYDEDGDFTISVTAGGSGVLTLATLVAHRQSIPHGVGLVADPNETGGVAARLPRLAADITGGTFLGLAAREEMVEYDADGIEAGVSTPIVRKGRFGALVEGTVTSEGDVYCRFASGSGGSQLGAFRADSDTSTAALVPNARFRSTGTGVQVVEFF
jgi:hypothetical protein